MGPIGIFGGTFDPVHIGHLRTAYELRRHLRLDEVRFVPCGQPPHGKRPVAPAAVRLEMLRAALADQPGFVIDERELERSGPSYTVDTLMALRADLPSRPLALIVGMDAFVDIGSWHRTDEILELAHVIVAHRPGARLPDAGPAGRLLAAHGGADGAALAATPAGRILVHAVTQLEISSSAIRAAAGAGDSARFLVPDAVARIIATTGCYAA